MSMETRKHLRLSDRGKYDYLGFNDLIKSYESFMLKAALSFVQGRLSG
jgi:hypothetical protein